MYLCMCECACSNKAHVVNEFYKMGKRQRLSHPVKSSLLSVHFISGQNAKYCFLLHLTICGCNVMFIQSVSLPSCMAKTSQDIICKLFSQILLTKNTFSFVLCLAVYELILFRLGGMTDIT